MAPDNLTTSELLSHLSSCEECGYYVCAPVLCKGSKDPTHEGYWFEKCLHNAQPTPNKCTHFTWRTDLGKGKTAKKTPCPGFLCRQKGAKRAPLNSECLFGVCVQCCRHLQPRLPTARACTLGSHREGVVYPNAEVQPTPDEGQNDQPPTTRARRAKEGATPAPKNVSKARAPAKKSSTRSEKTTPSRAPPKKDSFAMPVTPAYLSRFASMDAEKRRDEDRLAERDRQERTNANKSSVFLRWWTKDGETADAVEAPVDNLSCFHPKDVPLLVNLFHCDTQLFQYYDSKKRLWLTGSQDSATRDLKKLNDEDMCYRSVGVTSGVDMPGSTKKQPAPVEFPSNNTPRRPMAPFNDYPEAHSRTPGRVDSPSGTEPPRSGSSTFSEQLDDDTDYPSDPFDYPPYAFDFDDPTPSFTPQPATYTSINRSQPPLPALFPSDTDTTPAQPSTSTAPPADPRPKLNLSSAPRGRTKTGWPWCYVCDMAAAFDAIRVLEDGQPPMALEEAFTEVCQAKFIPTTYGDQIRAWRAAALVTGERERWIRRGRTEGGEWQTFMRTWRQR